MLFLAHLQQLFFGQDGNSKLVCFGKLGACLLARYYIIGLFGNGRGYLSAQRLDQFLCLIAL